MGVVGRNQDVVLAAVSIVAATLASTLASGGRAQASEPIVEAVEVVPESNGTFRFSVTVRHADTGEEHYAIVWQVLGADGTVYGERKLLHPHVEEQPFSRSQSGIAIPAGIKTVMVRSGDNRGDLGPAFEARVPGR